MTEDDKFKDFNELAKRFVSLANSMKEEGFDLMKINAALMSASCTYATYVTSGNDGYLKDTGIDKVVNLYRNNMINIQKIKKANVENGAS